jgi:hypothetical protein
MTVAAAGLTIWDWRKEAIKTSAQQIQNLAPPHINASLVITLRRRERLLFGVGALNDLR